MVVLSVVSSLSMHLYNLLEIKIVTQTAVKLKAQVSGALSALLLSTS